MKLWSWNQGFKFLQLEILKTEGLDLKIGQWDCENFLTLGMKILNWQFRIWSCSWRFVWEIYLVKICLGDFSFWRCVHEDLFRRFFLSKICSRDFSFYEEVFMKICLGDFSFWRFVQDIFPLKICSGDFSFWRCVQEIFPFMKISSWRFV